MRKYLLGLFLFTSPLLVFGDTFGFPIDDARPEIDLSVIPRKHNDLDRKPGSPRIEVLPTPKDSQNETRHMSPPNVTYKHYCVNGYFYIMFIVSYGWDPTTGRAERIETHIQQQFDRMGRAITCK